MTQAPITMPSSNARRKIDRVFSCGRTPLQSLKRQDTGSLTALGIIGVRSQGRIRPRANGQPCGVSRWSRQQEDGRAPQPAASIEGHRQRDDRQPQGLEHESLLRAVRNANPVKHDVQHGHQREDRDPAPPLVGSGS